MHDNTERFVFPELPDEAVVALNEFIETLYNDFQNYYFVQIHRGYQAIDQSHSDQLPLPLDVPPF